MKKAEEAIYLLAGYDCEKCYYKYNCKKKKNKICECYLEIKRFIDPFERGIF